MKRAIYASLGLILILLGFLLVSGSINETQDYSSNIYLSPPETGNTSKHFFGPILLGFGAFLLSKTRRKRGQVAMEFLMTYGWAVVAAIIGFGVLSYYGVFTPGQYSGGSSIVTAPFYTEAWNIKAGSPGTINIELRNNGGVDVTITKVDISNINPDTVACTPDMTIGLVEHGTTAVAKLVCTNLNEGDSIKGDITITYTKQGSILPLTSSGTIADTAVQGSVEIPAYRVFVTSQKFNGNLGGIGGADLKCQTAADTNFLNGEWTAWISDDLTYAPDRIYHSNVPYILLNGEIIADDWNDLLDCGNPDCLQNPININELGEITNGNVWTATNSDGSPFIGITCDDWTDSSFSNTGIYGNSDQTGTTWTLTSSNFCAIITGYSLYCIEQP